jgi:hypothetical protein
LELVLQVASTEVISKGIEDAGNEVRRHANVTAPLEATVHSGNGSGHVRVRPDGTLVSHPVGRGVVTIEEGHWRIRELVFRFLGCYDDCSKVDCCCSVLKPIDMCISVASLVEGLVDFGNDRWAKLFPRNVPVKTGVR